MLPAVSIWMMLTGSVCPWRCRRALACSYSSSDQGVVYQIMMWPPAWRLRPWPAEAGWMSATGICLLFQSRKSCWVSSVRAPGIASSMRCCSCLNQ